MQKKYENLSNDELIKLYNKTKTERDILDLEQKSKKIALNSLYGCLGNQYSRYYDERQAIAITLTGQLIIKFIENKLNNFLNKALNTNNYDYVIAVDTDSNYIRLNKIVEKLCPNETDKNKIVNNVDKFCKEVLSPYIEKQIDALSEYLNGNKNIIEMKREVIADKGLWKAKKMYCLNVYDSEGVRYKEPKLKIMGIEVQRSSTPNICRTHLKQCIKIMLTQSEKDLVDHIENVKNMFMDAPIEDIAFPRGVNGMEKYDTGGTDYKKSTPIHVKGAIVYNRMLKRYNIDKYYSSIKNGDKIKFIYLKEPNPSGCKIISFSGKIPSEFKLESYINKELQFEKAFLDPLDSLLKSVGWSHEEKNSLEDFFA